MFLNFIVLALFVFLQATTVFAASTAHLRIISLAPAITEILYAIGAGDEIVGVDSASDYPRIVKQLPQVGSYTGLDLEAILLLHPDVILVWGDYDDRFLQSFTADNHVKIKKIYFKKLADIPQAIDELGQLTGHQADASKVRQAFVKEITLFTKNRKYFQRAIRVYYQIGESTLMTINHTSWVNEAITLCGGENVFANLPVASAEISWESLVAAAPAVILTDSTGKDWQSFFLQGSSMPAVKNHAVYQIDANLIDRPGPRLVFGVKQICSAIELAFQNPFQNHRIPGKLRHNLANQPSQQVKRIETNE